MAYARTLALRAALTFAAFSLGAILIVAPTDGDSTGGSDEAAAASSADGEMLVGSARSQRVPSAAMGARPTPSPTPAPGAPANAGQVAIGGDQRAGPLPAAEAGIPENVDVATDLLGLKDALAAEITAYGAEVGGIDVGVAVTDLQTGQTISIGGNVPHKTGCTINMFALLAAVSEFQAGNASPSWVSYSIRRGVGGSYPPEVRSFLDVIFGSYTAGVQRAREMMASWGMRTSFFDHVPYYGGEDPPPNVLTALETNDIFVKLYSGQLFNPEWTAYTLQTLRDIAWYVQYILPKYLPGEATVAHKIGYYWDNDGWVNNDAGIVTFTGADGTEKAYVVTYFSQSAGTEYIGYSFGARLSRIVWDYMAPKYGVESASWTPPAYVPPPESEPTPQSTPEPTAQPEPTPVATLTPVPTAAPTATPRPKPSASPTPKP